LKKLSEVTALICCSQLQRCIEFDIGARYFWNKDLISGTK